MDNDLSSSVRIAVLIDADNTSPRYAEALLEELAKYGTPTIKRAYGDFSSSNLGGWTRELNARAIRAIHQNAFTKGKNSTDSALIIDAMDLLYAGNVEAFALVSSDSDFTGLALRLRESGKVVYGLGEKKTPQSLQNACDRFIALEVLGEDSAEPAAPAGRAGTPAGDPSSAGSTTDGGGPDDGLDDDAPRLNLESALTRAVNATADDEGWTTVSAIGNHLSRTHASFDPRNFGHAKLSTLVAAQPYLESRPEGRQILVRLKGKPTKAPTDRTTADKAPADKTRADKTRADKTRADKTGAEQAAEAPEAAATAASKAAPRKASAKKATQKATQRSTKKSEAPAPASTPEPEEAPRSVTGSATTKPTVTKTARRTPVKRTPPATS